MFEKILIANRGEIACRVIRTCRTLGIRTVAVYSEADADAQHVRQADEAYPIGGPRPAESYLRGDAIIEVARRCGAQAIHPGYGFLSENADFADAVEAAGIAFIGPKAASMRKMGSKAGAKELMQAAGVPVVPGYTGEDQDPALLQREADAIGYPLMIKAAHGGGGKGMRIVRESGEFAANLESCQREARNAFGRDRVLLERYVERPRHIEIQIFGDNDGQVIHLNERECSAQRRYQKVLEESPSPFLTPELRAQMGAAAVQAGHAIDYVNAGTVEFIVGQDGGFYFMEINTRLQVEHPVTELVTGLDLVEWQLRVAAGEPLPLAQDAIVQRGHAIEVRLYAEDPEAGFLPGSGRLERLRLPAADAHVRLDSGVIEGDTVTIFYDPMIAKLIVSDADRPRALARLRAALADSEIAGPKSNIEFLERLARHPAVVEGTIDTGYLDRHLDEFMPAAQADEAGDADLLAGAAVAELLAQERRTRADAAASNDPTSPWAVADGWRLGHGGRRSLAFLRRDQRLELSAQGSAGDYRIDGIAAATVEVRGARLAGDELSLRIDGRARRLRALGDGARVVVHDGERRLRLDAVPVYRHESSAAAGSGNSVNAPMPGRVVVVKAAPGDAVEAGQEVMVIEAMKMELSLKAPRAGTIAEIRAAAGDFVEADAVLATLESA
ncbi:MULTISPECIES: acetyl-CoA carboxylase biotin carboxylase subunit [Lysobacter]|uniref:Acetyl/propionyl/methylcrotonyl-CoA carboxylase subunit alpha n=1 Tax=Lysobacter yananisis TaxID=1003114 RepID=A0ABY9P6S0_9GAMM|nr:MULTISPECIES: acetyl/propionyl/methylcrotonyl-CoA carboxylase subunit alpha [Lysobacter]QQP99503.1 acetyl/propionyl/methylcrotonyl-CoA carboxylase subunit alpha [Lysobacter enzymogenes]WMT02676.1 acetyl/propionyl/methylcrotonyl-CoA carboxylase subunit alpha [Lysobacter yananisis]